MSEVRASCVDDPAGHQLAGTVTEVGTVNSMGKQLDLHEIFVQFQTCYSPFSVLEYQKSN